MKKSFFRQTLKGTKLYIILTLILTAINARLIVYVPMFVQYALDGVIMKKEGVIPQYIINTFYADTWQSKLIVISMWLIIINVLIFIVTYNKSKVNTKFNLRINRNIKQLVLEHIPKLEYTEFSSIDKSNVIQRVNNDAATYADFFNSQINLFLDTIFICFFAVLQILNINIVIGVFVAIICAIIIILSIWFFKVSNPLVEKVVDLNKYIIEKTSNSVQNSKMLKIFNRKEIEIREFKKINEEYRKRDVKLARIKVIYRITTHTIRNFKEPFILLWGGILAVKGELTLVEVSLLLTYATRITSYIYDSVTKLEAFNDFIVAYKKLKNLMECKEEVDNNPEVKLYGDIKFKDVNIIINDSIILKNINLIIGHGENVAIVGDNGSGKTVLVKTMLGFYEYTGDIYIGNYNIKDISKKSIRNYIGVILQDTYLFTGTIKENINTKDKELSEEELIEACKAADIYEDIQEFPQKLDTIIEAGGSNISGGQKQRIAIARTIIQNNGFIVLDDSLSKLDTKTKLNILNNAICIQKGMIIISYDIDVVKACDKVIFINNNKVKVGQHEDLLKSDKKYKQIIEIKQNTILEDEEN